MSDPIKDLKEAGRAEIERERNRRVGGCALALLVTLILVASYFVTKLVAQSWMREVLEAGQ